MSTKREHWYLKNRSGNLWGGGPVGGIFMKEFKLKDMARCLRPYPPLPPNHNFPSPRTDMLLTECFFIYMYFLY